MDSILLQILLFFIGILLITFFTVYFLWPSALIRFLTWCGRQINSLKVRYAEQNGYRFCYFSRGKPGLQPSILMLHGFANNKDFFPKNLHVICIDLPGHGETTCLPGDSYTTFEQVKRIHQFVECTGLNGKPFHLVGISMGGMIAGVYAAQYPSEVCGLSLLCPTGLRYPRDTDIMRHIKEQRKNHNNIPLIPSTARQAQAIFRTGLYTCCIIPHQLLKGYFEDWLLEENFFKKCFLDIFGDESLYSLHDSMDQIRAPTQVIWGKEDKIVDPSGAEVLAKGIPHSQVYLLDKCGHYITADFPKKSSELLLDFYTFNTKNMKLA